METRRTAMTTAMSELAMAVGARRQAMTAGEPLGKTWPVETVRPGTARRGTSPGR